MVWYSEMVDKMVDEMVDKMVDEMVDEMRTNRRTCSCSFILDKTDTNCEKSNQTKSGSLSCLAALTSDHPQSFLGKFFETQKRESDVQQLTDRARPTLLSTQPSCFPFALAYFHLLHLLMEGPGHGKPDLRCLLLPQHCH